jgi:DNA polymerase III epsilon subunit-like protein
MTAARGHSTPNEAVASAALWGSLRLVVLDVETCNAVDGDHIIDIAVVTCRRGLATGQWDRKLNPGVPIDSRSQQTHGITDEEVAGAQTFAQAEPELTRLLTARDGEQFVLVAHNTPFDVSRLKLEYERTGKAMPDLPVLDTMALAKHVGLRTGNLASLLGVLSIVNSKAHSALGDATATARAAMAMLVMAASAGEQDFDALLPQAMASRAGRTSAIKAAGRKRRRPRADDNVQPSINLPAAHLLGHAEMLPEEPTANDLTGWIVQVTECLQLRCPYL